MLCKAPGIFLGRPQPQAQGEHPDEFGFLLDHVQTARSLNRSSFTYYPDPSFEPLGPSGVLDVKPGSHVVLKVPVWWAPRAGGAGRWGALASSALRLQGKNLIPAAAGSSRLNYTVLIGGQPCTLTVSDTQLLCDSPSQTGRQPVMVGRGQGGCRSSLGRGCGSAYGACLCRCWWAAWSSGWAPCTSRPTGR